MRQIFFFAQHAFRPAWTMSANFRPVPPPHWAERDGERCRWPARSRFGRLHMSHSNRWSFVDHTSQTGNQFRALVCHSEPCEVGLRCLVVLVFGPTHRGGCGGHRGFPPHSSMETKDRAVQLNGLVVMPMLVRGSSPWSCKFCRYLMPPSCRRCGPPLGGSGCTKIPGDPDGAPTAGTASKVATPVRRSCPSMSRSRYHRKEGSVGAPADAQYDCARRPRLTVWREALVTQTEALSRSCGRSCFAHRPTCLCVGVAWWCGKMCAKRSQCAKMHAGRCLGNSFDHGPSTNNKCF